MATENNLKNDLQTHLGVDGEKLEHLEWLFKAIGVVDVAEYLQMIKNVLGTEMSDALLAAHVFPYRTIRLATVGNGRGEQVRELIKRMSSKDLARVCDLAERYQVNDATDWLRWVEFCGLPIHWSR